MDTKEEQYERIEQYLDNSLPSEEWQAFDHELQQNPAVAHEVTIHRHLQEAIRREAQDTLMAQALQKAATDYFADESQEENVLPQLAIGRKSRHVPFWYGMAASISLVLLVGAGLFYLNSNTTRTNQELVASNFTIYDAPAIFRSGDKDDALTLKAAFVAYNQKEYQKAVGLFEKSLLEDPRQIVPNFYIGQCKLALHDARGAIPSFQKVVDHNDSPYVEQATWYLALAYLDLNKNEKATALLHKLSQEQGAYSERATRVLEELQTKN